MAAPTEKMITLKALDGTTCVLPLSVAKMSDLVKMLIGEDESAISDEPIAVEVRGAILNKIVEFCKYYKLNPCKTIEKPLKSSTLSDFMPAWYVTFVDSMSLEDLYELILRANYMQIPPLLDVACGKIAAMVRGKSVEQLRKEFNIKNDFPPEEEAAIKDEQKWLEEP